MRWFNPKNLMAAIAVLTIEFLIAGNSFSGIVGSAHDFTASGKWTQYNPFHEAEICIFCHTPHHAASDAPLWNHQLTSTVFMLYSSASLNATISQPTGVSKLCLSCHDGTLAVNAYRGSNPLDDGRTAMFIPGVSGDLMNDHPVSFTYDSALAAADGALHDPATVASGNGGTILSDLLVDNRLECSSCHDVHNKYSGNAWLLTRPRELLCLTCHDP